MINNEELNRINMIMLILINNGNSLIKNFKILDLTMINLLEKVSKIEKKLLSFIKNKEIMNIKNTKEIKQWDKKMKFINIISGRIC